MSKIGEESLIWGALLRVADRIRAYGRNSVVGRGWRWYCECAVAPKPSFWLRQDGGYSRQEWQFQLRQWGMKEREQSVFLALQHRFLRYLLQSSVSSFGLFLALSGIFFLISSAFLWGGDLGEVWNSLLQIFLSFLLLPSSKSLSHTIKKSALLRPFLFSLCEASEDTLDAPSHGYTRAWSVLLCAVTLGGFSMVVPPSQTVLILGGLLCLFVLLSIPELALLLFGISFPFVFLLPHPTILLGALCAIIELSYFVKVLCGRRFCAHQMLDFFALLFCIQLLFGGVVGFGNLWESLSLTVLAGIYFPAKNLLSSPKRRRQMRISLQISAFLSSLLGVWQYFMTDMELKWVDAERFANIGGRVCSTFDNPNVLAIYLLIQIPLSLCGVLDRKERCGWRIFFSVAAVAEMLCMILTWTRGAWLGVMLEIFLLLLFYSRQSLAMGLALSVPSAAVLPYLPDSVLQRLFSIGRLSDSSTRYRLYTWRGVLRMVTEHPFGIGVGRDAFLNVYPHYAVSGIEGVMHAHQIFLQMAAELGIVGLLVFVCLFGVALLEAARRGINLGGGLALCGVLTMGLFDHLWYCAGMLAMLMLTVALATQEKEEE